MHYSLLGVNQLFIMRSNYGLPNRGFGVKHVEKIFLEY